MAINIEDQNQKTPGNGKMIAGLLLLLIGLGFLFQQLHFVFIPDWLFSWPLGLIILGLFIGARCNFRKPAWLILVLIGSVSLLDDALPWVRINDIVWPLAIITFGIWLILRRNDNWSQKKSGRRWDNKWNQHTYGNTNIVGSVITPVTPVTPTNSDGSAFTPPPASTTIPPMGSFGGSTLKGDDYLDAVSIFGGVKKIILSKSFKGGEIVNIFGGAELNFIQADINGQVIIDITQIFGGTKIIVPANWQVVSDLAAVFASVDDKRMRSNTIGDGNKILVLKGVSIFAGVEIRSY
jgi:predicted membrane protein